jgi:alkanesulfonate monooxygenase SsuD/methylene tetrahydromethanopterin reductase-like flavin-dependent oxidoreductase (luciferase family)
MDIGIGIPNTIRGITGAQLLDWAKRAEGAGFSTLASIGAVSYPSYEELTLFAAAGAVTERIKFLTNVLIAPARTAAELAKQAATVDQLTGGRLTLGLGAGWRPGDFSLTGHDFGRRGQAFDELLGELPRAWAGELLQPDTRPVGPPPIQSSIPVMIGGVTEAAVARTAKHGIGWTAGGMPPDAVASFADRVRSAWSAAGREGAPRIVALVYFGLGATEAESQQNVYHYYQPMGHDTAEMIAGSVLRSPEAIRGALQAYEAVGVDELILDPSVGDVGQVDLLAEVVFG